jgi:hypothetical protein
MLNFNLIFSYANYQNNLKSNIFDDSIYPNVPYKTLLYNDLKFAIVIACNFNF